MTLPLQSVADRVAYMHDRASTSIAPRRQCHHICPPTYVIPLSAILITALPWTTSYDMPLLCFVGFMICILFYLYILLGFDFFGETLRLRPWRRWSGLFLCKKICKKVFFGILRKNRREENKRWERKRKSILRKRVTRFMMWDVLFYFFTCAPHVKEPLAGITTKRCPFPLFPQHPLFFSSFFIYWLFI